MAGASHGSFGARNVFLCSELTRDSSFSGCVQGKHRLAFPPKGWVGQTLRLAGFSNGSYSQRLGFPTGKIDVTLNLGESAADSGMSSTNSEQVSSDLGTGDKMI